MRFAKFGALVGAVAMLAASGCAKPPVVEKAAAENALNAAVAAAAEQYLPADMETAKKILAEAENASNNKRYQIAKQGYVNAQAAFAKAMVGVEAAKQALVTENTAAIGNFEKQWQELAGQAKKKAKKMSKQDRAAWKADELMVTTAVQAAKNVNAANPAEAKNQLNSAKNLADKWAGILNK